MGNDGERPYEEGNARSEDWQEMRSLSHRMLDDMLDYLEYMR